MMPQHARSRALGAIFAVLVLALAPLVGVLGIAAPAAASHEGARFQDDFESGAAGWNATGLWNLNHDRYNSSSTAWYFGVSTANGTDDNTYGGNATNSTDPVSGTLTSPAIDLVGLAGARLRFWTWWEGEGGGFEAPIVKVLHGAGNTTVYETNASNGTGTIEVDLSAFANTTIRLQFVWDTIDGVANDYEGWYVDDVQVWAVPAAPSLPDLVALEAYGPTQIVQGDEVRFKGTLRNAAPAAVNQSFVVTFLVNGTFLDAVTVPGLGPGQMWFVQSAPWRATGGNHTLTLLVDTFDNVTEADEANNDLTRSFDVATGVPDLAVAIRSVEKATLQTDATPLPHPLQPHEIRVSACNFGSAPALNATLTLVAQGNTTARATTYQLVGAAEVPALLPGACWTETFHWDAFLALGDVDLVAYGEAHGDRNPTNNVHWGSTFVLLGGTGEGVVVPVV